MSDNKIEDLMTITLKPDQDEAIQQAIDSGVIRSVDESIDAAMGALPSAGQRGASRQDAVRRLGEFGESSWAALD